MAFILIPGSFAVPNVTGVQSVSRPNSLLLAVNDDGGGGVLKLTGLGAAVAAAASTTDIQAMVVANGGTFRSVPLLTPFRRFVGATSVGNANGVLFGGLLFRVFPSAGTAAVLPGIVGAISAVPNVPILSIQGPGVAGTWFVDIQLRAALGG